MKHIFLLTLLLLTASVSTLQAQNKDKKGKKDIPVVLTTRADSVSYASAKMFNRGLVDYLKQNFGIEEADMPVFMKGFNDYIASKDEKYQRVYMSGQHVADMLLRRFMPNVQTDFSERNVTINKDLFVRGFSDGMNKVEGPMTQAAAEQYINHLNQEAVAAKQQENIEKGRAFLAENAKQEGVITTPSGLQYRVLREGKGAIPKATDEVVVKYEGRLIDGTVFDSSYNRTPDTNVFRADRLIKGWTEALTMMPVGSKWELYVPQELAYGERSAGQIPPYSTLIFTMELLDIRGNTAAQTAETPATAPEKGKLKKPMLNAKPPKGAPERDIQINPGPAK